MRFPAGRFFPSVRRLRIGKPRWGRVVILISGTEAAGRALPGFLSFHPLVWHFTVYDVHWFNDPWAECPRISIRRLWNVS